MVEERECQIGEPGISKWEFHVDALCYNCHVKAFQEIEIHSADAAVRCTNCLAERHYTIHDVLPRGEKPRHSHGPSNQKFEEWHFVQPARCINCGVHADQLVAVNQLETSVKCSRCSFTRLYKFNMFSEPRSRR